jgi:glycosyltransferase involved in cell wall biosynthesis
MPHIAVNTRLLLKGRLEGIGRVAHETLTRLVKQHPDWQFSFFFDRPYDESFIYAPNVKPYVLYPPARHPFLYVAWFEGTVAHHLKRLKPDVFFSPDAYLSLRSKVKQVPLFHDLAFEHFPNDIDFLHRKHYHTFFPRYARKASHILTVSEFTKQDIVACYGIPPEKITVAWNGAGEQFHPLNQDQQNIIRQKYTSGNDYFLYIGAIHPRKNLDTLLKAFDRFKEETNHPAKLVITGRWAWQTGIVREAYDQMKFCKDVIFTGYVSDEDLNGIYASALAVCYVSRFEGFGLPIVEAFRTGTAVITSNVSSMPEIAGDAGILVPPDNISAVSAALQRITFDTQYRQTLIRKGTMRAEFFSWDQTADVIGKVLENV